MPLLWPLGAVKHSCLLYFFLGLIGKNVSVLVLLYIIANFKMNCTQTEIYKKNTQHDEKEKRVECAAAMHRNIAYFLCSASTEFCSCTSSFSLE